MYINEDLCVKFLKISRMQLRFILSSGARYDFKQESSRYYVNLFSLILLKYDIIKSKKEFKKVIKDFIDEYRN